MSPPPGTDSSSQLFEQPITAPHFDLELRMMDRGSRFVAGVDEAGRGPLAGPVVAAAVILDPRAIPSGLNDSKKLSEKKRDQLFEEITRAALAISWHANSARCIDRINILQASLQAMARSVAMLPGCDGALFDGRDVPLPCREFGQAVIKGDATSLSIAAASIIAKVVRDRIMVRADEQYPIYGFAGHKGYGSAKHMEAIREHGPSPLHRMTFAPLKDM